MELSNEDMKSIDNVKIIKLKSFLIKANLKK